jgi:TRAP-type C4-dicarboxylate transport system substrate-binding protein
MQRKTFTHALLALAAAALFAPLAAQAQTVKLTLGHGAAPGNPRHEASLKFAEVVKAKTAGRIEVQVAPSAQLGDDAAMVTALRTGALDMSANCSRRRRRPSSCSTARSARNSPTSRPRRVWSCSATGTTASAT